MKHLKPHQIFWMAVLASGLITFAVWNLALFAFLSVAAYLIFCVHNTADVFESKDVETHHYFNVIFLIIMGAGWIVIKIVEGLQKLNSFLDNSYKNCNNYDRKRQRD